MTAPPVRFEGVGKRFHKGEYATAIRDLIPNIVRRLRGRAARGGTREFWALRNCDFEVAEGEAMGGCSTSGGQGGPATGILVLLGALLGGGAGEGLAAVDARSPGRGGLRPGGVYRDLLPAFPRP